MRYRIVRDRLTNDKTKLISDINRNCLDAINTLDGVRNNVGKNVINGLDKDLDISFYKETCIRDISNIRKLLDKIENNINKL